MEYKVASRYRLVIFIPLILGILIDNISFISKIYADLFWFISILFIVFWFWTGKLFARLNENKRKGFFQGNTLCLISFIIFKLWVYLPEPTNIITTFLEDFSQYYVICMTPIVSKIIKPSIAATGAGRLTAAYIFMFIVFSIGFSYELFWKRNKIRVIIITSLISIICIAVISVSAPYVTHEVKDI